MGSSSSFDKSSILDDLFDNIFIAILVVDKNRKCILANDRFCELFGYEEEEILEDTPAKFHINEEYFHDFGKIAFDYVIKEKPLSIDYEFKRKDGTRFWAKITGNPIKDKDYALWTLVDITEIKKIQMQLKEQKRLLFTLIDEIPYPVVLKNYDAKFVLVNKATAKLYNSTPQEMIGKDDGDFIPDKELAEFFRKNVREIMDKGETQTVYEDSVDVETNEKRNYMSIKKPFINENGEKFILVLANDITELNKQNEELSEKERLLHRHSKLVSMGEMLGNIAHQWRQPLSAISTLATGAKLKKECDVLSDDEFNSCLDDINETTQYLSRTIDDFRNFFDPRNNEIKEFDIQDIIDSTLILIDAQFSTSDIKIKKEIQDFKIKSPKNEFMQVLVNILNNAKDALVKVKSDRKVLIKAFEEGNYYHIIIHDNANGIDEEIIDKVFEPYFTTKHKSVGTGVGLYMAEEIIVKHLLGEIGVTNASFEIDEKEYFGARFEIKIPKVRDL